MGFSCHFAIDPSAPRPPPTPFSSTPSDASVCVRSPPVVSSSLPAALSAARPHIFHYDWKQCGTPFRTDPNSRERDRGERSTGWDGGGVGHGGTKCAVGGRGGAQTLLLGKLSDYQNFRSDSPEHNNKRTFWPPFDKMDVYRWFLLEILYDGAREQSGKHSKKRIGRGRPTSSVPAADSTRKSTADGDDYCTT